MIDPFYTVPLLIAVTYGLLPLTAQFRAVVAGGIALAVTTAYLFYGAWVNEQAQAFAEAQLAAEGVTGAQVSAYPTVLQPYLRRIVVRHYPEIRIGYVSMWRPAPIGWDRFTPPEHQSLEQLGMTRQAQQFYWFAMGQVSGTLERGDDGTLIAEMHDMRYGLPGRPQRGFWALRAVMRHGELVGGIEKVFYRPSWSAALMAQIYRDAFVLAGSGNRAAYEGGAQ